MIRGLERGFSSFGVYAQSKRAAPQPPHFAPNTMIVGIRPMIVEGRSLASGDLELRDITSKDVDAVQDCDLVEVRARLQQLGVESVALGVGGR